MSDSSVSSVTITTAFGNKYFEDFISIFEITKTGAFRSNEATLHKAEAWFNQYSYISLISGVSLTPIQFIYDVGFW